MAILLKTGNYREKKIFKKKVEQNPYLLLFGPIF